MIIGKHVVVLTKQCEQHWVFGRTIPTSRYLRSISMGGRRFPVRLKDSNTHRFVLLQPKPAALP